MNRSISSNRSTTSLQGFGGSLEGGRGMAVQVAKDVMPYAISGIALLALTSCGTPGTASDPFYKGSDEYYADNDPGFATAQANAANNARFIAEQTAQANATPLPTNTPTSTETPFVFAGDQIFCAPVESTVSEAVVDANSGVFPSFTLNGIPMQVSLDHEGQRIIASLQDVMADVDNRLDVAAPGDNVCIAGNSHVLQQMPTPTPAGQ